MTDTDRLFYLVGQYKYPAVILFLVVLLATVLAFYFAYRWVGTHRTWIVRCVRAALSYPPVANLRERYDRELRWLLRRLAPGEYLGLHLTVGLLLAVGCLWFFGDLAEEPQAPTINSFVLIKRLPSCCIAQLLRPLRLSFWSLPRWDQSKCSRCWD